MAAILTLPMSLLLSSCGYGAHPLSRDDDLAFSAPAEQETVSLPYTFSWQPSQRAARYAVLFDSVPMKPGAGLLALVPKTDACRTDPACPTPDWLSLHSVYVVDQPQVTVESLLDRSGGPRERDLHTVLVIPLDSGGRRVGEYLASREFIVRKGSA